MPDQDAAGLRPVVAVDRTQQGRLAGTGRAMQGDAFAGRDAERGVAQHRQGDAAAQVRSEEHTSELPSLMRNSYAVFCLKKQTVNYILSIQIELQYNKIITAKL